MRKYVEHTLAHRVCCSIKFYNPVCVHSIKFWQSTGSTIHRAGQVPNGYYRFIGLIVFSPPRLVNVPFVSRTHAYTPPQTHAYTNKHTPHGPTHTPKCIHTPGNTWYSYTWHSQCCSRMTNKLSRMISVRLGGGHRGVNQIFQKFKRTPNFTITLNLFLRVTLL